MDFATTNGKDSQFSTLNFIKISRSHALQLINLAENQFYREVNELQSMNAGDFDR